MSSNPFTDYVNYVTRNASYSDGIDNLYIGTIFGIAANDPKSTLVLNQLINEDKFLTYNVDKEDVAKIHKRVVQNKQVQYIKKKRDKQKEDAFKEISKRYPALKESDIELLCHLQNTTLEDMAGINVKKQKGDVEKSFDMLKNIISVPFEYSCSNISDVKILFVGNKKHLSDYPSMFIEPHIHDFSILQNVLAMLEDSVIVVPYGEDGLKRFGITSMDSYRYNKFLVLPWDCKSQDEIKDVVDGKTKKRVSKNNKLTSKNVQDMLLKTHMTEKKKEPISQKPIKEEKMIKSDSDIKDTNGLMLIDCFEDYKDLYMVFRKDHEKFVKKINSDVNFYVYGNNEAVLPRIIKKGLLHNSTMNFREAREKVYSGEAFRSKQNYPYNIDFSPCMMKIREWRKQNEETDYPLRVFFTDIEIFTDNCDDLNFDDLESTAKKYPINLISYEDIYDENHYTLLVFNIFKSKIDIEEMKKHIGEDVKITVKEFDDEKKMIKAYLGAMNDIDPDIITGWNVDGFDLPYIFYRSKHLNIDCLGKHGKWNIRESGKYRDVTIPATVILDYLRLYKERTLGIRESYKLGYIADYEIGSGKLDIDEDSMDNIFKNDINKFAAYNILDTRLVKGIDKKLNYINLQRDINVFSNIPWKESFGVLKIVDGLIYDFAENNDYAFIASDPSDHEKVGLMGGYVRKPIPGVYEWLADLDLRALYPYTMARFNIFPDTFIGSVEENIMIEYMYDKDSFFKGDKVSMSWADGKFESMSRESFDDIIKRGKYIITSSGDIFMSHEEKLSPLYSIIEQLLDRRDNLKKLALENYGKNKELYDRYNIAQLTVKVIMNSIYGAMCNVAFRLFHNNVARSITVTGRELSKCAAVQSNNIIKHMVDSQKIDVANEVTFIPDFLDKASDVLPHVVYGDSVASDTKIKILSEQNNERELTIAELHGPVKEKEGKVREIQNVKALTFSNGIPAYKDVHYTMAHKCDKNMYRITSSCGRYVDVTEDHSIMKVSNNRLEECSPKFLNVGDVIIVEEGFTNG